MSLSNRDLVRIYGKWIKEYLDTETWNGYLITMNLKALHRPPNPIEQMHQEIIIFYSKLLISVVRNPTRPTWSDRLPRGLFFPDSFLGYKKMTRGDILLNDGLHMRGIMIVPKKSRLKYPLNVLIQRNETYYYGDKLKDIHIEAIEDNSVEVTEYGGKSVQRERFSADDILILPRTVHELPRARTPDRT
jgi:hypothetical protein